MRFSHRHPAPGAGTPTTTTASRATPPPAEPLGGWDGAGTEDVVAPGGPWWARRCGVQTPPSGREENQRGAFFSYG